jgi:predicted DNA-binding transcriptional regulator AlpA
MARQAALPPTLAPRLISRESAAAYVCLSVGKFDALVKDGRMPRPKKIDRRLVWDVRALDAAADDLPEAGGAPVDETWDDVDAA